MVKSFQRYYFCVVAVTLFLMGIINILSVNESSFLLDQFDPFLFLKNRWCLFAVGMLEIIVSAVLLLGQRIQTRLLWITWLTSMLIVYRVGLRWNDAPNLGDCLGNFDEWLPIPPPLLAMITSTILVFCLASSSILLIYNGLKRLNFKKAKPVSIIEQQTA
jgi:hypothetical protein